MSVCVGAGLTEDGDNVVVATSGAWGSGVLSTFGGDDSVGAPIYCDADGKLRTVPDHGAAVANVSSSAGLGAAFDGTFTATGPTITATLRNPSAVRAMAALVVVTVKFQFSVTTAPASLYAAYVVGGDSGDLAKYHGFPVAHTTEEFINDSFTAEVDGGAVLSAAITPRIASGSGVGRFLAMGVGIRIIGATKATG